MIIRFVQSDVQILPLQLALEIWTAWSKLVTAESYQLRFEHMNMRWKGESKTYNFYVVQKCSKRNYDVQNI